MIPYIPVITFPQQVQSLIYDRSPAIQKLIETQNVVEVSILNRARAKLNRDIVTKWWVKYATQSRAKPSRTRESDGNVITNFDPTKFQAAHSEVAEALRALFLHYVYEDSKATPTGVNSQFHSLSRDYMEEYKKILLEDLVKVSDIYDNDGDGRIEEGETSAAYVSDIIQGVQRSR